ncbi:MAG: single-stranded DNA-binding protein, partial [Atopobiaceae bacterium]|nr:single-stranded DNA-binding protein [Atopobiaceae bacterium]
MSVNRVVISGNLTRDPELRSTQSGMNILTFGMAVNDRRRNAQTGEWEDYANFVDCVLFGNRAEWLSRDLHKGKKVFVEGKLRYSTWERDGQRRSKLEVVVDDIDYDRPPRQQQGGYVPQQTQQQQGGYMGGQQQAPQPQQQP